MDARLIIARDFPIYYVGGRALYSIMSQTFAANSAANHALHKAASCRF